MGRPGSRWPPSRPSGRSRASDGNAPCPRPPRLRPAAFLARQCGIDEVHLSVGFGDSVIAEFGFRWKPSRLVSPPLQSGCPPGCAGAVPPHQRPRPGGCAAVRPTVSASEQPLGAHVVRVRRLMHPGAEPAAGGRQFARVVAVRAANHNHHIRLPRHLHRRRLALLGRLANGVNESGLPSAENGGASPPPNGGPGQSAGWSGRPRQNAGRSASWSTSSSVSITSNSARSPVNPRTSTWSRWPMMTG